MNDTTRFREWQYLTGADFKALDRSQTAVVVTFSPLEVHGPHLPVITDNLEAEALAERAVHGLLKRFDRLQVLRLPPVYVASDVVPQAGSVKFRSSTIIRVLTDLGRSLCAQGFKKIWVSSFHGGPRHFVPLEVACDRVNRKYGGEMVSMFSLLINRLTGGRTDLPDVLGHLPGLTPEALVGDAHGGAIETSLMLHLLGEHVAKSYRQLPPRTVNLKLREQGIKALQSEGRPSLFELLRGFRHKLKYYEDDTYAGQPAIASAETGAQICETLGSMAEEALAELWEGTLDPADCHSPLWPLRWVFCNDTLHNVFERAMAYRTEVF